MVNKTIHCFSHDKDDVVLTSQNWLWVYPNKKLTENSICVLPELCDNPPNGNNENSYGIKIVGYKINGESYFTTLLKF